MKKIVNIAAYKFVPLQNLRLLRNGLLPLCKQRELKGTILLSQEGINLFVAGASESVEWLLSELRSWNGLADLEPKISETDYQPFTRMLVRIKREIIAFGVKGIEPAKRTSPKLSAQTLKQWLDEGRAVRLLDTRNDYEVKLGTFKNALPIGIDHFREFPAAVQKLPQEMKEEPIVMFCTGGIRCEKAGPFMESMGFRNVLQLEGGILKYFEECGGAHYDGECFVFDQRTGVNPTLQETEATTCFACQTPLTPAEQADDRFVAGDSCPYCFKTPEEQMRLTIARRHRALRKTLEPLPGSVPYDNHRPINVPAECEGGAVVEALARVVRSIPADEWALKCEQGLVLDNALNEVRADQRVHAGERYFLKIPDLVEPDVSPEIQLLHEDEALIVLDKPAPLPMHPAGRFNRNTLQYFLERVYYPEKPRPVHRLDANTTGVVLLARSRHFASRLQPQFAAASVRKTYLARVLGNPKAHEFECAAPISASPGEVGTRTVDWQNGLQARTKFRVRQRHEDGSTLLEVSPLTGRTNQIRVHLWHLGFPIAGDPVYLPGNKIGNTQTLGVTDPPMCLHAWQIAFRHPLGNRPVEFAAPPPAWSSQTPDGEAEKLTTPIQMSDAGSRCSSLRSLPVRPQS